MRGTGGRRTARRGMRGFVAVAMAAAATVAGAGEADAVREITQYGVTWTFREPVRAGRFVTGDWWVVGPVEVVRVTPGPGPAASAGREQKSAYGAASTRPDDTLRNGSMIPARFAKGQGYDSRLRNFNRALSVDFPRRLDPGTSLVSTISNGDEPVDILVHEIMWRSEKKGGYLLKAAAVLTVLDAPPPEDAFRPPYAGTRRPLHRFRDVDAGKLLNLEPPPEMPPWERFERYLERPWLDHMPSWLHQVLGPNENQVNYGREFARVTGMAALMLNTRAEPERKRKLLIGLVQLGIDLAGIIDSGRQYEADGGHYAGRKFPILFAGHLLGDERMLHASRLSPFAEDMQTYYGEGWAGQKALYQIVVHTGARPPYEEKDPGAWTDIDRRSEGYRVVNGTAWPATALAVRLMGLVKPWNHDAFLDFCDRWMSADDPRAAGRQKARKAESRTRPKAEGKTHDAFTDAMWARYRATAPQPEWARNNRKWQWDKNAWEANPKPAEPAETYAAPK